MSPRILTLAVDGQAARRKTSYNAVYGAAGATAPPLTDAAYGAAQPAAGGYASPATRIRTPGLRFAAGATALRRQRFTLRRAEGVMLRPPLPAVGYSAAPAMNRPAQAVTGSSAGSGRPTRATRRPVGHARYGARQRRLHCGRRWIQTRPAIKRARLRPLGRLWRSSGGYPANGQTAPGIGPATSRSELSSGGTSATRLGARRRTRWAPQRSGRVGVTPAAYQSLTAPRLQPQSRRYGLLRQPIRHRKLIAERKIDRPTSPRVAIMRPVGLVLLRSREFSALWPGFATQGSRESPDLGYGVSVERGSFDMHVEIWHVRNHL